MQTDIYNIKLPPSFNPNHFIFLLLEVSIELPIPSILVWFEPHPCPWHSPLFSNGVYLRSPASPWMVFLMRRSIVVSHWSRRDTESNSLTASVNASLFCSSWASSSFWQNVKKSFIIVSFRHLRKCHVLLTDFVWALQNTRPEMEKERDLPLTVWVLLSLRTLETSPHTSRWPTETQY